MGKVRRPLEQMRKAVDNGWKRIYSKNEKNIRRAELKVEFLKGDKSSELDGSFTNSRLQGMPQVRTDEYEMVR